MSDFPRKKDLIYGGPERVMCNLGRELGKRHQVTILTRTKGSKIPNYPAKIVRLSSLMLLFKIILNLQIYTTNYDIINVFGTGMPNDILSTLFNLVSRNSVLMIHGLVRDEINIASRPINRPIHSLRTFMFSLFSLFSETLAIKTSHKIIVPSKQLQKKISNNFGVPEEKILVIHHGVEEKFFPTYPEQKKGNIILFVGGIRYEKGLDFALRSLANLKDDFEFVVVGEKMDYYREFQRLTNKLGLDKHLRCLDLLTDEEILHLYNEASMFLLPGRGESFGIVVLEAMASGVPVIVSNECGVKEIIEDGKNGFIVKFNDVKTLTERITYLLNDKEKAEKMVKNALSTAGNFVWNNVAQKYLKVYKQVVKGRALMRR